MSKEPKALSDQLREFFRRNMNRFLIAAFALLLLQDIFGTHGMLAMRRAEQEAASVRQEINQLNEENRQLQERVTSLKSDPEAVEKIAREEMGLARPGEIVIKIPPKSGDASPVPAQPAAQSNR